MSEADVREPEREVRMDFREWQKRELEREMQADIARIEARESAHARRDKQ